VSDPTETERRIEALLFAAAGPLSAAELAERLPEGADVGQALMALKKRYEGRGVELACVADRWRLQTAQDLAFLIGGPDGFDEAVRRAAGEAWSLGPLTLPHPLVRVVVAEQLYRACSLLANHPYHRGG